MGDRAVIQFIDGDKCSPAVYVHWMGSSIPDLLQEHRKLMKGREGDLQYAAARFVGVLCATTPNDNTGIGMWNAEKRLTAEDSHGDSGVFIVDVNDFTVKHLR